MAKTTSAFPLCLISLVEELSLIYTLERLNDMKMDKVDYEIDSKAADDVFYCNMSYVSEFSQISFRV